MQWTAACIHFTKVTNKKVGEQVRLGIHTLSSSQHRGMHSSAATKVQILGSSIMAILRSRRLCKALNWQGAGMQLAAVC